MIVLTRELINAGRSKKGGFDFAQLELLGPDPSDYRTKRWPPLHGWLNRAIGRQIPVTDYKRFRDWFREKPEQATLFETGGTSCGH